MSETIPIISLFIALLAVFVGPLISFFIARRQFQISIATASRQLTVPVQQNWIDSFRDLTAQFGSLALHCQVAGFENRSEKDLLQIGVLSHQISLMLDDNIKNHADFEKHLHKTLDALNSGVEKEKEFFAAYKEVLNLARNIIRIELNHLKEPINL